MSEYWSVEFFTTAIGRLSCLANRLRDKRNGNTLAQIKASETDRGSPLLYTPSAECEIHATQWLTETRGEARMMILGPGRALNELAKGLALTPDLHYSTVLYCAASVQYYTVLYRTSPLSGHRFVNSIQFN
jgi:hypothetical protein